MHTNGVLVTDCGLLSRQLFWWHCSDVVIECDRRSIRHISLHVIGTFLSFK